MKCEEVTTLMIQINPRRGKCLPRNKRKLQCPIKMLECNRKKDKQMTLMIVLQMTRMTRKTAIQKRKERRNRGGHSEIMIYDKAE